jgi:hypothetical protein
MCDGIDFGGLTCASYSYPNDPTGDHGLHCSTRCDQIITDDCFKCGNGRLDPGEQCDAGAVQRQPRHDRGSDILRRDVPRPVLDAAGEQAMQRLQWRRVPDLLLSAVCSDFGHDRRRLCHADAGLYGNRFARQPGRSTAATPRGA